jgi:predicted GNAT superfamily acetyltransferase
VAEWELDSPRVEAALEGRPIEERDIQTRILVPATVYVWRTSGAERERALTVQAENRSKFQAAFSHGLAVVGFTRDTEGNGIYELGSLIHSDKNLESQEK